MNERTFKWADVLTVIFIYAILAVVACLLVRWLSEYVSTIADEGIVGINFGIGVLFLGLLIFRCVKLSQEVKLAKFESMTALVLCIIASLAVVAGITYILLSDDKVYLLGINLSDSLSIASPGLSVFVPIILVVFSPLFRARNLSALAVVAFVIYTLAVIIFALSWFGMILFMPIYLPLIFGTALCVVISRLIKARANVEDVKRVQQMFGVFCALLLALTAFCAFCMPSFERSFDGSYVNFSRTMIMSVLFTFLPCVMYYRVMQAILEKYKSEGAEEKGKREKLWVKLFFYIPIPALTCVSLLNVIAAVNANAFTYEGQIFDIYAIIIGTLLFMAGGFVALKNEPPSWWLHDEWAEKQEKLKEEGKEKQ